MNQPPKRSAVIIQPPFLTDFFLSLLVIKRLESYVAVQCCTHTHTHAAVGCCSLDSEPDLSNFWCEKYETCPKLDHLKYCMSKMRGVNDEFTSRILSSHWRYKRETSDRPTVCGLVIKISFTWYWAVSWSVFIPVMDPLLGRDVLIMTNSELHLIWFATISIKAGRVSSFIFLQEATFVFTFVYFVALMCNSTYVHVIKFRHQYWLQKLSERTQHTVHSTQYTVLYTTGGSFLVCFSHYDFRFGQAACQWLTQLKDDTSLLLTTTWALFHNTATLIYRRWWRESFFRSWRWAAGHDEAEGKLQRHVWVL